MTTNRLEAFSYGVLAIIITIMVLELKVPEGNDLESLRPLLTTFITSILSFIYLSIYWSNPIIQYRLLTIHLGSPWPR
ncbi:MAG: DUF1211 domain-containing protein [Pyrinomonadaceae bacterium]|nr:DUF1211 domain-containing protein [Sphingobacteriaceae bacterium]